MKFSPKLFDLGLGAEASPALASGLAAILIAGSTLNPVPAAALTDGAAIGKCVVSKCTAPLARCVATSPSCLANLICIQTCTNKPDEAECQIRCGDKFTDGAVEAFTKCAVTDQQCVPQRGDDGSWPVPKTEALVAKFSPEMLTGPWYISAGLNRAFDTFDCQLHRFESPSPSKLVGNLQWRIKDPVAGTNFVTRYAIQEFVQDENVPGILYNHDNEFLHYQDDWYILAARDEEYVVVYYRGSNDAWDGYGGAVVYTRSPTVPKKWIPEIKESLAKINLKWEDFEETDNSCRAAETKLEELEADLQFVETKVAGGLQFVGKEIAQDVVAAEQEVIKDFSIVEREILKDVRIVEQEVEKDLTQLEEEVKKDLFSLFKFKK